MGEEGELMSVANATEVSNSTISTVEEEDDLDASSWDFHMQFEFAVHGVLLFSVGMLGLIGNLFSIIILSRPQVGNLTMTTRFFRAF